MSMGNHRSLQRLFIDGRKFQQLYNASLLVGASSCVWAPSRAALNVRQVVGCHLVCVRAYVEKITDIRYWPEVGGKRNHDNTSYATDQHGSNRNCRTWPQFRNLHKNEIKWVRSVTRRRRSNVHHTTYPFSSSPESPFGRCIGHLSFQYFVDRFNDFLVCI